MLTDIQALDLQDDSLYPSLSDPILKESLLTLENRSSLPFKLDMTECSSESGSDSDSDSTIESDNVWRDSNGENSESEHKRVFSITEDATYANELKHELASSGLNEASPICFQGGRGWSSYGAGQQSPRNLPTRIPTRMTSSSASNATSAGDNRKRRRDGDDNSADESDGEGPDRRRKKSLRPQDAKDHIKLACPYRKHNPRKYNLTDWSSCAVSGYTSIARVKYTDHDFLHTSQY